MTLLPPPKLYKYRSLAPGSRAFTRDIILSRRLFWPAPDQFNDPFDCQPVIEASGSRLAREAYTRRVFAQFGGDMSRTERQAAKRSALARPEHEIVEALRERHQELRRSIGVCSITELPADTLMWGHYADSHRGICLEFDARLEQGPNPFFFAYPVIYTADRPVMNLYKRGEGQDLIDKVLLSKADYWSYEREWRMIDQKGGPGLHQFNPAALTGVILGAAISAADRAEVEKWCNESLPRVPISEATMDERHYRLSIRDVGATAAEV